MRIPASEPDYPEVELDDDEVIVELLGALQPYSMTTLGDAYKITFQVPATQAAEVIKLNEFFGRLLTLKLTRKKVDLDSITAMIEGWGGVDE